MTNICENCRAVNILAGLRESFVRVPLGTLQEIIRKQNICGFCFLVTRCVEGTCASQHDIAERGAEVQCFVASGPSWGRFWDQRDYKNGKIDGIERQGRVTDPGPQFSGLETRDFRLTFEPEIRGETGQRLRVIAPVVDESGPREQQQFCRRLLNEHADFDLIRTWLHLCRTVHAERCSQPKWLNVERPSSFRLIDIKNHQVVNALSDASYSALSYVWGAPKSQFLISEDDLRDLPKALPPVSAIPKTIQDAMHVTTKAGLDYLWVDAFCIAQYPPLNGDKTYQLRFMNRIYKSAEFVILATACDSANGGIAGIRPRQIDDVSAVVDGVHLALSQPIMEVEIEKSIWNRRAWTFQEGLLPRRAVVFGKSQTYWLCQCDQWSESDVLEPPGLDVPDFVSKALPNTAKPPERVMQLSAYDWQDDSLEHDNDLLNAYVHLIARYSHRRIGRPHDGLNAVSGILQLLQSFDLRNWHTFHHGLPEIFFDVALLWTPRTTLQRPQGWTDELKLPSWTWAGWFANNGVGVLWDLCHIGLGDISIIPAITWYFVDTGGSSIRMPTYPRNAKEWVTLQTRQPCGIDTRRLGEQPVSLTRLTPIPRPAFYLHFITTWATFFVGQKLTWKSHEWDPWQPGEGTHMYTLTDERSRFSGTINLMDTDAMEARAGGLELIFLSYARDFCSFFGTYNPGLGVEDIPQEITDHQRSHHSDFSLLNVMWIRRFPQGYVERVQLAQVLETSWLSAQPKTEWIVLG